MSGQHVCVGSSPAPPAVWVFWRLIWRTESLDRGLILVCRFSFVSSRECIPVAAQTRSCLQGAHNFYWVSIVHTILPSFTLDKNWGPGIRTFVKKTGLGFKSELRWPKQDLEYKSEAESDDEDEFEVGEFE
jgi:hypothetical protein